MPGQSVERPRVKLIRIIVRDIHDRETTLEVKGKVDAESLEYLIGNLRALVGAGGEGRGLGAEERREQDTYYSKLRDLIASYLRSGYFTSIQVRDLYREMYNEDLKLTTISTYLGRMVSDGVLERVRHGRKWIYEYVGEAVEEVE
ncbi:MAG: hypothetical protein ACP5NG_00055 [Conexivisphaera sp.]